MDEQHWDQGETEPFLAEEEVLNYFQNDALNEEESEDEQETNSSFTLKIAAFITALAFLVMAMLPIYQATKMQHPPAELFKKSNELSKQLDEDLLKAIVKIQVTTDKPGINSGREVTGSGFNVYSEGIIVTNHHVIEDAGKITVVFPNGQKYNAKNWVSNAEFDLAIIELKQKDLPSLPLNMDDLPEPGDGLLVIGNPLDFNSIVVDGSLTRYLKMEGKPIPILCMDLPVYPGNSGSPVFDMRGRVVGVVFGYSVFSNGGLVKNYGLAVPIAEVLDLLY